jgi:hypothetical protein
VAMDTSHMGRDAESPAGLLRRLVDELTTLVRQELALATSEITRSISSARTGITAIASGGAVLFAGFLVLLAAAVLGLAEVMEAWLAALIVGLIVAAVGYGMLQAGRKKLDPAQLKPVRTQESLRRDKEIFDRRPS